MLTLKQGVHALVAAKLRIVLYDGRMNEGIVQKSALFVT
jgi:hypothetical protein